MHIWSINTICIYLLFVSNIHMFILEFALRWLKLLGKNEWKCFSSYNSLKRKEPKAIWEKIGVIVGRTLSDNPITASEMEFVRKNCLLDFRKTKGLGAIISSRQEMEPNLMFQSVWFILWKFTSRYENSIDISAGGNSWVSLFGLEIESGWRWLILEREVSRKYQSCWLDQGD